MIAHAIRRNDIHDLITALAAIETHAQVSAKHLDTAREMIESRSLAIIDRERAHAGVLRIMRTALDALEVLAATAFDDATEESWTALVALAETMRAAIHLGIATADTEHTLYAAASVTRSYNAFCRRAEMPRAQIHPDTIAARRRKWQAKYAPGAEVPPQDAIAAVLAERAESTREQMEAAICALRNPQPKETLRALYLAADAAYRTAWCARDKAAAVVLALATTPDGFESSALMTVWYPEARRALIAQGHDTEAKWLRRRCLAAIEDAEMHRAVEPEWYHHA